MAASDQCGAEKAVKSDILDPRLDFFSEKFDPLLALATPNLKIPVPTAKCHDNIGKLKCVLEERDGDKQKPAVARKRDVRPEAGSSKSFVESGRRFLPHQMPIKSTTVKIRNNIFTRMENMEGPLSLLKKCMDERIKTKIWTRHGFGLRGYCIAYIVAFDKHWNLALEDVTEVWTKSIKHKVPANLDDLDKKRRFRVEARPPKVEVLKTTKKFQVCKRHLDQVMMRGEHVVTICLLKDEVDLDMLLFLKQLHLKG
ncbi:unnamed protein product [Brassicogethes aeneus]|uniref:Sm domain-containing protein n=1 Tax=Brassicogethes aeneus TaxID=1431903 RepID=A0A9P0BDB2_BRAAE|nr:unnamed protein product [Brassicogethes aeneus]